MISRRKFIRGLAMAPVAAATVAVIPEVPASGDFDVELTWNNPKPSQAWDDVQNFFAHHYDMDGTWLSSTMHNKASPEKVFGRLIRGAV